MPAVPLHVVVSHQCRYLNFDPYVLLASACMPLVMVGVSWLFGTRSP
jgi:hypothetical protein